MRSGEKRAIFLFLFFRGERSREECRTGNAT
jgi:hypothetical protein